MKTTIARGLALVPRSTKRHVLHHGGTVRVERTAAGVSIEAVRIRAGGIQKERLELTPEEFTVLSELLPARKREARRTA